VTVIGIDDTDSRTEGMCTTYVATRIAEQLEQRGAEVSRKLLVRLNPAVERKTRGNAALAIHTDCAPASAKETALETIRELTAPDVRASPGLVVADCEPESVPPPTVEFYNKALRDFHRLDDALELADKYDWQHQAVTTSDGHTHKGHGRIGAVAAIGAWQAFDESTYEYLSYRELSRCGTQREVNEETVFEAADKAYPVAWDTVDRVEGEPVCVPNAPGPILHGIRGDDPEVCKAVATAIESEPVDRSALFITNQGTDVHLGEGEIGSLRDGAGYKVNGVIVEPPDFRTGGHGFFEIGHPSDVESYPGGVRVVENTHTVTCAAFEPTKRFRDHVRQFKVGDKLTAVGEYDEGTVKLEKFCVRSLRTEEYQNPVCPSCGQRMESAGAEQGYRCRDCGTAVEEKASVELDRRLEVGWYEVPPCARRHVAKPLIRGGFDAPTHPER
jgi:tRNA(Ile2)-agmatinylcytidine synthase